MKKIRKQKIEILTEKIVVLLVLTAMFLLSNPNTLLTKALEENTDQAITILIDNIQTPEKITEFDILKFTEYPDERLFEEHLTSTTNFELTVTNIETNEIIALQTTSGYRTIIKYTQDLHNKKLNIALRNKNTGQNIFSFETTTCNNNLICEPCERDICEITENSITCNDCQDSSKDHFCDITPDGKCDPDCEETTSDPDCIRECGETCGIDETVAKTCVEYAGTPCEPRMDCIGGDMIYAYDEMNCCVGGTCGNIGEYIETTAELINHPESTVTPTGKPASDILDQGINNYCLLNIQGKICQQDEYCKGEEKKYLYELSCCVGRCLKKTPVIKGYEYDNQETLMLLSIDEMDYLKTTDISKDQNTTTINEEIERLKNLENPSEQSERTRNYNEYIIEKELLTRKQETILGKTLNFLEKNKLAVAITGGVAIILIIILAITVFSNKSKQNMIQEGNQEIKYYESLNNQKAEDQENYNTRQILYEQKIQKNINYLINRGYNYNQIKQILLKEGITSQQANTQIMKNYQLRENTINTQNK